MTVKPVLIIMAGRAPKGEDKSYIDQIERCCDIVIFPSQDLSTRNESLYWVRLLDVKDRLIRNESVLCDLVSVPKFRRNDIFRIAEDYGSGHSKIIIMFSDTEEGNRTRSAGEYKVYYEKTGKAIRR